MDAPDKKRHQGFYTAFFKHLHGKNLAGLTEAVEWLEVNPANAIALVDATRNAGHPFLHELAHQAIAVNRSGLEERIWAATAGAYAYSVDERIGDKYGHSIDGRILSDAIPDRVQGIVRLEAIEAMPGKRGSAERWHWYSSFNRDALNAFLTDQAPVVLQSMRDGSYIERTLTAALGALESEIGMGIDAFANQSAGGDTAASTNAVAEIARMTVRRINMWSAEMRNYDAEALGVVFNTIVVTAFKELSTLFTEGATTVHATLDTDDADAAAAWCLKGSDFLLDETGRLAEHQIAQARQKIIHAVTPVFEKEQDESWMRDATWIVGILASPDEFSDAVGHSLFRAMIDRKDQLNRVVGRGCDMLERNPFLP